MDYKIIITKRFENKYLKKFKKYFSINKFVEILKSKKYKFISLQNPFEKFKIKINGVNFRWVVFIILWNKIIPLLIYLKKNKNNWENISWLNTKEKIIEEHNFATIDIENKSFKVF